MRTIMWLSGGLSVGLGMVTLARPGLRATCRRCGDQLLAARLGCAPPTVPTEGFVGLGLVAAGIALMVTANATVWKETGGY